MKFFFVLFLFYYVTVLSGCSSLLYYPQTEQLYDPKAYGLHQKDIRIDLPDKNKVHAWYFESAVTPSKGTLVMFHGNAENLSSHFISLSWLPAAGYNYIIFDYPGYGQSTGQPTPENTLLAGKAILQYVAKNIDSRPLIVFGHSLGGIIAMRSVLDEKDQIKFKAIIIDSSFYSYQKIAQRVLAKSWITWIFQPLSYVVMSDEYAPKNLKAFGPTPILFIHGQNDQVIPPIFSNEMYDMASEPKALWEIPMGTHGSTFFAHQKTYRKKLLDYLDGLDKTVK